jgi:hypothetical protein
MKFIDMATAAHNTAVEKGWYYSAKGRSLCEEITLIHSEIDEALEAFRDSSHPIQSMWLTSEGKPEGFGVELADALIRMGDSMVGRGLPDVSQMGKAELNSKESPNTNELSLLNIPELLGGAHVFLSKAFVAASETPLLRIFRMSENRPFLGPEGVSYWFAKSLELIQDICLIYQIDLDAMVAVKLEYNASRPYRHGGKRA